MPLVTIKMAAGRSREQKQALTARITEAFRDVLDTPPEFVWTIYQDVDAEEWFVGPDSMAERKRKREAAAKG